VTGTTGPTGATGPTGPTGPSSLAALQGSPCTIDGNQSTLNVSVNPTTGAVSLTCTPVYKVSATISGGTMTHINLRDQTILKNNVFANVSTSSSVLMPSGHEAIVVLTSGEQDIGGGHPFRYTCPGEGEQPATAEPGFIEGTFYEATCQSVSLSGDYAVTATFTG
jgi:hypothetical protein